jgi:osmotically-inducible protein OsmY
MEPSHKSDAQIQLDVLDELKYQPCLEAADVGVTAENGVVTLLGFVPSDEEKSIAERAAKRVHGVRAVANDLVVRLPGHGRRTDSDIALAVANALEWNVYVPRDCIKITVDEGIVTLEGDVARQSQKDVAISLVRRLIGVRSVVDEIRVTPTAEPIQTGELEEPCPDPRA